MENKAKLIVLTLIGLLILSWFYPWVGIAVAVLGFVFGCYTRLNYAKPQGTYLTEWPSFFFTVCWFSLVVLGANSRTIPTLQSYFIEGKVVYGYSEGVDEDGGATVKYKWEFIPDSNKDKSKTTLVIVLSIVIGVVMFGYSILSIGIASYDKSKTKRNSSLH